MTHSRPTTRLAGLVAVLEVFIVGLGLMVFAGLVFVNAGGLQI